MTIKLKHPIVSKSAIVVYFPFYGSIINYSLIFFKYVEAVLSGRERPDNSVGRKLLDLVNSVPKMTPDEFEKMINSNMKVNLSSFNYNVSKSIIV